MYGMLGADGLITPLTGDPYEASRGDAHDALRPTADRSALPLDEVTPLAPAESSPVVAVGRNFVIHAAELGNQVPSTRVVGPWAEVLTGTPAGVSQMHPGDTITVSVEGIDELTNAVVSAS